MPSIGDEFTVLTRASGSGAFVASNMGTDFCITYTPTAVTLTVVDACDADIACDNNVNVADLLAVISAWGPCTMGCPPRCVADVNNDCAINVSDLLAVISSWGPCP